MPRGALTLPDVIGSAFKPALLALVLTFLAGCSDSGQPQKDMPTSISAPAPNAAPKPAHPAPNARSAPSVPQGSGFDFYVLALSWSPAYCTLEGRQADPSQCRTSKPFRFIVHGLWPQYERGFPDRCDAGAYPTREQIRSVADLTPSAGLVRHEWERHGSCSGLSPADYFTVMRLAAGAVAIPAQFSGGSAISLSPQAVESAFTRANPGMSTGGIATSCDSGLLTEVRICLTKSLAFRACPEVDRSGCRSNSIKIEPAR